MSFAALHVMHVHVHAAMMLELTGCGWHRLLLHDELRCHLRTWHIGAMIPSLHSLITTLTHTRTPAAAAAAAAGAAPISSLLLPLLPAALQV
jgi:hypothetical protein